MMKRSALALFALLLALPVPEAVQAADNPVIGTWKMQTYTREVLKTGARSNAFGDKPDGYISYSPDGRMYAIFGPSGRAKPAAMQPTEKEAAALHASIVSYAGTYTMEGPGKVVHHVDISWNESFTGTQQVRFFKLDGDVLTITTPPFGVPGSADESRYILVWKKVK
jgi:hypothetical protein